MSSLRSLLGVLPRPAALLLALGCAAPTAASAGGALPGEELLERGGELAAEWPEHSLEVTPEVVRVWGVTAVPDGSRLQLALSGVDAVTRAELLKAVRVRVQSLLVDVQSSDPQRSALSLQTAESVSGVLDRAGPLPHGWVRIRRGDAVLLRLWARLELPRSALEAALQGPLVSAGADANVFVTGLALSAEGHAP